MIRIAIRIQESIPNQFSNSIMLAFGGGLCSLSTSSLYCRHNCFTQPPSGRRPMRICFAVVFLFFVFLFFPSTKTTKQPFSGTAERIFMKLLANDTTENVVWNVVPPLGESRAAAWRMANVDNLCNLRYDSFAITRGVKAVALYNHEQANGCNLVFCMKFRVPTGFTYRNLHGFARFPASAWLLCAAFLSTFDPSLLSASVSRVYKH